MPTDPAAGAITAVVDAMSVDELRRALRAVPHAVAALQGRGPLAGFVDRRSPDAPLTRRRIGAALAHAPVRRLTVQQLDLVSIQLLGALVLLDGRLRADELHAETAGLTDEQREASIDALVDRVLVRRLPDGIELVEPLHGILARGGRTLRSLMLEQSVTKQDVAARLHANAVGADVPSGKEARVRRLAELLGDPDHLARVRDELDDDARDMFDRIVAAGCEGVPSSAVGIDRWYLQVYERLSARQLPPSLASLEVLDRYGLVWVEPMADRIGAFVEVVRAATGRVTGPYPAVPAIAPAPLHDPAGAVPGLVSAVHALLDRAAVEPLPGLKSGGLGVKVVRDLAKRIGRTESETSLAIALAQSGGLLERRQQYVGRGRTGTWVTTFEIDAERAAAHRSAPVGEQWSALVTGWLSANDRPEERYHHAAVRLQVLHDLLELPPGTGVPAAQAGPWIAASHWIARMVDVPGLVADLRVLGLAPVDGPLGLHELARTLLTRPDELEERLPAASRAFVVQADHTVVAPPSLAPDVRAGLEQLAVVESTGAATVYRLDAGKLSAHLAEGVGADDVLAFLAGASSSPLPPTLDRLVRDLERQRGGLAVRAVGSVVTADDVLALAAAVKVRAAQLQLVAPTVAVSELPPAKVVAALRAKGLAPAAEGRDRGVVLLSSPSTPGQAGPEPPSRPRAARGRRHAVPLVTDDDALGSLVSLVDTGAGEVPSRRARVQGGGR